MKPAPVSPIRGGLGGLGGLRQPFYIVLNKSFYFYFFPLIYSSRPLTPPERPQVPQAPQKLRSGFTFATGEQRGLRRPFLDDGKSGAILGNKTGAIFRLLLPLLVPFSHFRCRKVAAVRIKWHQVVMNKMAPLPKMAPKWQQQCRNGPEKWHHLARKWQRCR